MGGDLLEKGNMGAVLASEVRQAGKVGHEVQVKERTVRRAPGASPSSLL
jgi:hypothetical protein